MATGALVGGGPRASGTGGVAVDTASGSIKELVRGALDAQIAAGGLLVSSLAGGACSQGGANLAVGDTNLAAVAVGIVEGIC